jgi:hypothetical protein
VFDICFNKSTGVQCNANLYVTPATTPDAENTQGLNQGFEIHWDEMESFAVQVCDHPIPSQPLK